MYEYLRKQTYKKYNGDGQVKITASDMLNELEANEQTVFANLRRLTKRPEVKKETFLIKRWKEGRKLVFKQSYFWIE